MELTLIAVVGVVAIVAVAAFSERLGLAAPLGLVVVGIAVSFVPGVPRPEIEPDWVLAGALPPLLYSAAVNVPAIDFRRNVKPISGLAVLLVAVTTLGAGWLFHLLLPGVGWPAAFALGAVVSPTDAVAATAVGRRLGLPARLLTVLEGEGLVNDASALVLLRSAVLATAGSVTLAEVAGHFVYSVVLAVAVGAVVGVVNVRVRALLEDSVLNTAISFVVPFVAFVPAEELEASGVLAVVVAGLVTGHRSPERLRAVDRLAEATNWRTLAFLLEGGIFLLMGLSLHGLLDEVHDEGLGVGRALAIGLLASAFVIVVRMVFVAPLVAALRNDERRAARAKPHLARMQERLAGLQEERRVSEKRMRRIEQRTAQVVARIDFMLREALGWRGGVVLAWSGMRGAITVAAAQTLPEDTPYRPQLVLIAFVVAVTTLLLQGLTLPWVIRAVRVPGDDPERLREEYARLLGELGAAASDVLDAAERPAPGGAVYDPAIVSRVRSDFAFRGRGPEPVGEADREALETGREQYVRLRLRVLEAERAAALAARAKGVYSSRALSQVQHRLDVEEARFQQFADEADEAGR
ncbi:sodium:proton antiporter [Streptomyces sp. NPDC049881]|uniref:cation:proton antiporter n=1 Tax=Streptomyces sp. NPDC049881 TaxID=3155778 RepID=UPI00343485C9